MTVQTRESPVHDGQHVVQFYDHDRDLVRAVGDYLTRALTEGAVAIVIATDEHRLAFEEDLVRAGIDASRAAADGTVQWLDAEQTLSSIMDAGLPDRAAFRRVVGGIVRRAGATGRPVRAYGEMVSLLWDAGNVPAAIELEKLWNELGQELRFALWCAYHSTSTAGAEHADAVHEVCRLHTAVMDEAAAGFRASPDAPFAARHFVASLLERRPYGARAPVDDAQLVVSELATNSVVHAGTPFSVSVRCDGTAIRIAVHDRSPREPIVRAAGPTARSGRGLRLVAAVARNWGVETAPDGKTVWAELSLG
ncbi:MAG: MEDS domain-containing protein [Solirubrobacterales bacterium]|nr:MEDS domain-containing protein [Solirubrobacterales bacterium]